ncbi:hypothetical protein RRG08_009367 [Elysia crispata]|uniref:Uncharacterized protein n=1 Tax=Elysia crispata TaxID=231223 RepID=A0AAE1DXY1_9GAST|nr:hypothetical protein RRG08_009367 [Elysia crispata]
MLMPRLSRIPRERRPNYLIWRETDGHMVAANRLHRRTVELAPSFRSTAVQAYRRHTRQISRKSNFIQQPSNFW